MRSQPHFYIGNKVIECHSATPSSSLQTAVQKSGFSVVCLVYAGDEIAVECQNCGKKDIHPIWLAEAGHLVCECHRFKQVAAELIHQNRMTSTQGLQITPVANSEMTESYFSFARELGWKLVGAPSDKPSSKFVYEHCCGHRQVADFGNVCFGDISCNRCLPSYSLKPSNLYLLAVKTPDLTVLKLGFSSQPEHRSKHQLGVPKGTPSRLLRTIKMPNGREAERQEQRLHRFIRTNFAGSVLKGHDLSQWINTPTEIYRFELLDAINNLLDEVVEELCSASDC